MKQKHTAALYIRFSILCLCFAVAVVSPGFAADQDGIDRGALKQLDDDLDVGNQLNWGTAADGDSWDGVTWQSPPDGRVTEIRASSKGLTGSSSAWEALTALIYLSVSNNQLTELDVTKNTQLKVLSISNNNLTALDVSHNTDLQLLDVDNNNLNTLDVSKNPDLDYLTVRNNNLSTLDVTKNTLLTYLFISDNNLSTLDVTKNTALISLNISNNNLNTLDVSKNTALSALNVSNNNLNTLDVTKNIALETLYVSNNNLNTLDISQNTALLRLLALNNNINVLDVSYNTKLTQLWADNNYLTALNVAQNTDLTDLQVSNNNLNTLDVTKNTQLTLLSVSDNQLTDLDVTKNTKLNTLVVDNNNLNILDVSKNTALTYLYVYNNQLTELDVSQNIYLNYLYADNNQLTELNVSRNTALTRLLASGNKLTSVSSIAGNSTVQTVNVHDNALPLSELYTLMGKTNLYLGQQNDVAFTAFGGAMATGAAYDVGAPERVIGGKATVFTIRRQDGSAATENIDYNIDNGIITFLVPGDYIVSMENESVYSKGQVDYLNENGEWQKTDFDSVDNPEGKAHPLAVVNTGRLSVLGDNLSTRLLVRVEQAGASVNAQRLAAGLDTAVFVNKVVLDGSELGQLYTAAKGAASDAESLFIVNQMHLESVAGGMDAILSSSARPFMNRLHGRAAIRPPTDSRTIAAANSWNAYAQLTGSSSGNSAYGFDAAATGLGQFASMSGHDGYLGYDLKNYGGFVSLDKVFGEGRFGLALGYSHTKVDWDDYGNETKSDNLNAGLYASRFFDSLALTWQANYGYADAKHTRNIPAAAVSASGDYDMHWFGTGLEATYTFDLANCLTLTPNLGLDYLHSRSGSFTEQGAGTAGAHVSSQNRDTFESRAGVTLAKSIFAGQTRITPSLSLGLGYSMGDRQTTVDYRFQSAANLPTFRAESAKLDRLRFMVGAGIDVALNDRLSLEAVYQGDFQSNYDSHYFRVGVGVSF